MGAMENGDSSVLTCSQGCVYRTSNTPPQHVPVTPILLTAYLLDVQQTPFNWVTGKSMHLRNVWPALSVSFHLSTWPPYPISRRPLRQVPRQHCHQMHPKVPRPGCAPTQQGVLLPADASTMTFEGSVLPRVARGCGLWQPLTQKPPVSLTKKLRLVGRAKRDGTCRAPPVGSGAPLPLTSPRVVPLVVDSWKQGRLGDLLNNYLMTVP